MVRQEPKHPVFLEAPRQSPDRIWMEMGFLSPVRGCVVGKEDEGTDHFIAPLDMIHKVQLELGNIPQRFYQCVSLRPPSRPVGRRMPPRSPSRRTWRGSKLGSGSPCRVGAE
jgi:hypothetical protein